METLLVSVTNHAWRMDAGLQDNPLNIDTFVNLIDTLSYINFKQTQRAD